jgi:hypothetical protein
MIGQITITADQAADKIVRLINASPWTPSKSQIADALLKSGWHATEPAPSPEHLAYRKIVAEIERCNGPDLPDNEETDAALSRLQEQACELETEIWAKPAKTLADLLLRAEIALCNENGVMSSLEDPGAYYDDRANAQLIRAVLDVLGGTNV